MNRADTEVFNTDMFTINGSGYDLRDITNDLYENLASITYETSVGSISSNRYLSIDYAENNTVTATITGKVDGVEVGTVDIVFKKISFRNSDLWSRLAGEDKVYLTLSSAGIYIDVMSELDDVTISSSNENIAKIENNYLVAKSVGEAIISATSGNLTENFVVKVLPPIYEIDLVYDNVDDDMGVQMTRVFGSKTYIAENGGSLTNTLSFEINSIYTVVNGVNAIVTSTADIAEYYYLLDWELDSLSKSKGFSISENGMLTIGAADKASVKLKAKYPLYESVEISTVYNAKFIEDGVNVGVVTKAQRNQWADENKTTREIEDIINADTLAGFDYVNAQAKAQYDATGDNDDYAIVLHSGVIMNKVDKDLYCSLYGNGNTLRQTREDATYNEAFFGAEDCATLKVVVDNITIQNAIIRAAKALEEGQSLFDYRYSGNGIVVDGREKYFKNSAPGADRLKNININFVIVENAYYCVFLAAADVNINGAIIRNSGAQSLYINTSVQDVGTGTNKRIMNAVVNLKNSVFSNAINMSIGIITEDLDESYDILETVIVDGQSVSRPKYITYFESVSESTVHIDGFCEIYNWKTSKELDFSFVAEYGIDSDMIGGMVRSLIDDNWDTMATLLNGINIGQFMCLNNEGVAEYQLAIGNIGVHYPMSGKIPEADLKAVGLTGFVEMDISNFAKYAPDANTLQYPLEFYCYDVTNPTIGPDDECFVNSAMFKRMINGF